MAVDSYGAKNAPQFSAQGAPDDAADLTTIAAYAARVGNRVADTSAVRQQLSGNDLWPGLQFGETDTGNEYLYVVTGGTGTWVLTNGGVNLFNEGAESTKNAVQGTGTTLATVNYTAAVRQRVGIEFTSQGQVGSAGGNVAGNLTILVDGVQMGGSRRWSTLSGAGNTAITFDRRVYAVLPAGARVITARTTVDSASSTSLYVNNPQIEIWAL